MNYRGGRNNWINGGDRGRWTEGTVRGNPRRATERLNFLERRQRKLMRRADDANRNVDDAYWTGVQDGEQLQQGDPMDPLMRFARKEMESGQSPVEQKKEIVERPPNDDLGMYGNLNQQPPD